MSWRPEGWENPYKNAIFPHANIFEDGADHMLEALKAEGKRPNPSASTFSFNLPSPTRGTLVFIPDD